jgi:hypothetical protein
MAYLTASTFGQASASDEVVRGDLWVADVRDHGDVRDRRGDRAVVVHPALSGDVRGTGWCTITAADKDQRGCAAWVALSLPIRAAQCAVDVQGPMPPMRWTE